ncbi:TorF family putative porin [Roseateles sp. BYS78W]|uniref:TorF family putative porin n=1 Tax=Pelomonas candidula TaxID=3299025 RepID=A0ABW7H825_9BURK
MKTLLSLLALAAALPALADEPAPADPLSFNLGAVSDYRYRGISQSRLKPALQGGIDYAAANGLYVGTWASTIHWIKDIPGGDASVEVDLYGGYKAEVAPGLTLDVGGLYYLYPSNKLKGVPGFADANTFELYGALSYGPVTAKYSHAVTNLFGNVDSKNSGYLDVTANFDLGEGFTLSPHVGHQTIRHVPAGSYTDYSLTLAKDFSGLLLSASVIGSDADKTFYASPANGQFLGKTTLVVGLKKTF